MPRINNEKETVKDIVNNILPLCDEVFFEVGYFYFSGFEQIYKQLKDKKVNIIIGINYDQKIGKLVHSNLVIKERIFETINIKMLDPVWKILLVDYLAQSGYLDEAKQEIGKLLVSDPRNLDALLVKSRIYAASKDTLGTIETQLEISKYDPQNAENYLQLLRNYMFVNNLEMAQKMKLKINEISPESEQAKLAEKELIKEVN